MRCQHCNGILSDRLILEQAAYLKESGRKERRRLKKKYRAAARRFKKPTGICEYCKAWTPKTHVHHVNGITLRYTRSGLLGGNPEDNALWNLVELCKTCHDAVNRGAIRIIGTLPLTFDPPRPSGRSSKIDVLVEELRAGPASIHTGNSM